MAHQNKINIFYSHSGVLKEDEKLLEPIEYILRNPLLQITKKLIQAVDYWLKIPTEKLQLITEITHIIFVTGIIIDDIQDDSFKRLGMLSTHLIYGTARSATAVNFALSIALEKVIELGHPAAAKIYTEHLLELARGQGTDIIWRDEFVCPSEESYKKMILRKVGAFFNLNVMLMKLFSSYDEDLSSLLMILGLYYQIRDDYCNLYSSDYSRSKGYCEDLTEGKFSFVIIHALHTNPEDKEIINILKQKTKDIQLKRRCIKLLQDCSFKYTEGVLEELDTKARSEIDRLGGNPFFIEILNGFKNFNIIIS